MTTVEVSGIREQDVKANKGWTKVYSVTMKGTMANDVHVTVTLQSESRSALEGIVPLERDQQRQVKIGPFEQTIDRIYHIRRTGHTPRRIR
jgi:hypothetical protein